MNLNCFYETKLNCEALCVQVMKVYKRVNVWLHSIFALDGRILNLQAKIALFLIWELDGRILKLQVKAALAVEERSPCTN